MRIQSDGPSQLLNRLSRRDRVRGKQPLAALEPQVVRLQVRGALLDQRYISAQAQLRQQRTRDLVRNIILDLEDVLHLAVVALREEMKPALHINQLRRDPQLLPRAPHAALEHMPDMQRAADLLHARALAREAERGGARGD